MASLTSTEAARHYSKVAGSNRAYLLAVALRSNFTSKQSQQVTVLASGFITFDLS